MNSCENMVTSISIFHRRFVTQRREMKLVTRYTIVFDDFVEVAEVGRAFKDPELDLQPMGKSDIAELFPTYGDHETLCSRVALVLPLFASTETWWKDPSAGTGHERNPNFAAVIIDPRKRVPIMSQGRRARDGI